MSQPGALFLTGIELKTTSTCAVTSTAARTDVETEPVAALSNEATLTHLHITQVALTNHCCAQPPLCPCPRRAQCMTSSGAPRVTSSSLWRGLCRQRWAEMWQGPGLTEHPVTERCTHAGHRLVALQCGVYMYCVHGYSAVSSKCSG
jgi:hypothetical protein